MVRSDHADPLRIGVQGDLPGRSAAREAHGPSRADHPFRRAGGRGHTPDPHRRGRRLARVDAGPRPDPRRRGGTEPRRPVLEGPAQMRFLIDTHVWLWSLVRPDALSRRVRNVLSQPRHEGWLSPISVWEIQVLAERGRVKLDDEPRRWLKEALQRTPL